MCSSLFIAFFSSGTSNRYLPEQRFDCEQKKQMCASLVEAPLLYGNLMVWWFSPNLFGLSMVKIIRCVTHRWNTSFGIDDYFEVWRSLLSPQYIFVTNFSILLIKRLSVPLSAWILVRRSFRCFYRGFKVFSKYFDPRPRFAETMAEAGSLQDPERALCTLLMLSIEKKFPPRKCPINTKQVIFWRHNAHIILYCNVWIFIKRRPATMHCINSTHSVKNT